VGNDQVKALVYINGWVPDEGESLLQLAQLNQNALRPLPYASTDGSTVVAIPPATQRFMAERAGRRSRRSPPPTRRWSPNPAPPPNSFSPQSARSEKRPPKLPVDGSI
jgi:hypothetical protein